MTDIDVAMDEARSTDLLCVARASICALAGVPHRHCTCGLPISPDAYWCSLCLAEMFRPRPSRGGKSLRTGGR